MFQNLILRTYMYFVGIRFCKTDVTPERNEYQRATFTAIGGYRVIFTFHKDDVYEYSYRWGRIRKYKLYGYIVHAQLDENFPEDVKLWHNMKIHFKSPKHFIDCEEAISQLLLSIYLDFLQNGFDK